jgi:hypothetical protein
MGFLQKEDGDYLLQENGDKIILDEIALEVVKDLISIGIIPFAR